MLDVATRGLGRALSILVLMALLLGGVALGQPIPEEEVSDRVERWDVSLRQISSVLDDPELSVDQIESGRAELENLRGSVTALVNELNSELGPYEERLRNLAPAAEGGPPDNGALAEERDRLTTEMAAVQAELGLTQDLEFRISTAVKKFVDRRRDIFTTQLKSRSPGVAEPGVWPRAVEGLQREARQIIEETTSQFNEMAMVSSEGARLLVGAIVVFGLLILLFRLKRWAEDRLTFRMRNGEPPRQPASLAVSLTLTRLLLPAAAMGLVLVWLANSGLIGPSAEPLVAGLSRAVLVVIGAYGLGSAFFAPNEPALRVSKLDDHEAAKAHRRVVALAVVVGLDNTLIVGGFTSIDLPFEAQVVVNTALLIVGGICLWLTATALRPEQPETDLSADEQRSPPLLPYFLNLMRDVVRLAAIAAPLLALLGYYFASRYVFYPMVFSGAALGIGILLFYMVRDGVAQFVPEDEGSSRFRMIPVLVGFMLICAAIPVLALIWGASGTDLSAWWKLVEDGFSVGDVSLSPIDALLFLVVFAIGYLLTRMIQGILSRNVLPLTSLDSGGRDAVVAGVGYFGVFVSALVAISATALDLSNLAIVAGALSVGIGFGLQNIVNNFVSGVILLIERPIKAGDWVELSSGMGYVKKVNVRSTEVQTFDRSTLFVPNSELISSPVINWTHTDMHGRIIVKVGVAYGTDPRKVEGILQKIADSHTMLLPRPAPYVLFRGFGSDSLDFEIRGVLRDVNWILNVQSDINYEISRRFGEEGIEIPFAQREVTIKNLSDMGEGIARVAGAATAPASKQSAAGVEDTDTETGEGDNGEGDGAGPGSHA